jgi:hypothetical protein
MANLAERATLYAMTHEWERRPDGLRDFVAEFARAEILKAAEIMDESLADHTTMFGDISRKIRKLAE